MPGLPVPGATPAPATRPVPAPLRSMLQRDPELAGGEPAAAVAADAFEATSFRITCNDTPREGDRASLLRESQEQGELHPLVGWYTLSNPCVPRDRPESATLAPRTGEGPCVDAEVEAHLLDGAPAQDSTCSGVGLPEPTPELTADTTEEPPEGTPVELNRWYSRLSGR